MDERTRSAETRLGQWVLDKWRLERLLGLGGMASVFEAVHRNGNRVAIKVLHADLAGSDEIRERFLAEGYAANRVSHPGVVTVRDEGTTDDGAVFLVMDLLRGQTLAERRSAAQEPLSVGEVLEISSQLLDVLVHAHSRGIVHRDIKPENVFLTLDKRVRLLDFGIAGIAGIAGMAPAARTHAIKAGSTLGTPAFMSPEQAFGHLAELDGRSDLWSLGATMYLLLTGVPVREPGSTTEQLLGAMTRPVPSLGSATSLPRSVIAVVDRALAFHRDERFPDARSMQLAVWAAQSELSTPDSRTTLPPASVEPVALSLRTPRADGSYNRPSVPSLRAFASSTTAVSMVAAKATPSALSVYVSLGVAVGLGIVIAARLTLQAPPLMPLAQPEHMGSALLSAPAHPATISQPEPPAAVPPSSASAAPSISSAPSVSARRVLAGPRTRQIIQ